MVLDAVILSRRLRRLGICLGSFAMIYRIMLRFGSRTCLLLRNFERHAATAAKHGGTRLHRSSIRARRSPCGALRRCGSYTRATRHEQWSQSECRRPRSPSRVGPGGRCGFCRNGTARTRRIRVIRSRCIRCCTRSARPLELRPLLAGRVRRLRTLAHKNDPHKQGKGHVFKT
jgi:hypothetical protein